MAPNRFLSDWGEGGRLLQRAVWEEEGSTLPKWFVASVRIRELGRDGIFKKNTFLCVNLHFVEQTKCS